MPQRKNKFKNFINGKWVEAFSRKTFEDRNPADTEDLVGIFPRSQKEDAGEAVKAAREAFDSWRKTPPPKRGEFLFEVGRILLQRKEDIAHLMTREMGKPLKESRGDVQEGIDTAFYAAGEGRRLLGETTPSELPNKFCLSIRIPVGVCALISPWNFPIAIPCWKLFPALMAGNTVILKPAEDTPACATKLVEILVEVGIPKGVVNLVHGFGEEVGRALVSHSGIDLVSFTGSAQVGKEIATVCGKNLRRHSLEMGGKNAQIVMEDADLNLAVEGALWGAFSTSGQRCTATSRLILHRTIAKKFTETFLKRATRLRVGNGLREGTDVGPLINEQQLQRVDRYVKIGRQEGARLLLGGKPLTKGDHRKGYFYAPTVFSEVRPSMRIAQEEIFGPVVGILTVKNLEEAIDVVNDSYYGLSSSVYTQNVNQAFQAIQDIQAGITYINGPTIGAEVHLPFGGVKNSGNGHREAGTTVYDIFTEWKSVLVDYSSKLQKAQIDTQ